MRIDRSDDGDGETGLPADGGPRARPPDNGETSDAAAFCPADRRPQAQAPTAGELRQARTGCAKTVAETYRNYAIDQEYERVREMERETVTPAMRRIEAEDPDRHLAGLENRLKGKDRLTEKVTKMVNELGHSAEGALGLVKDAIRYTFCYPEDRYTEGLFS